MDFTHDVSREAFKLGCLGVVGAHFDRRRGEWASTLIPIVYTACHAECNEAAHALLLAKRAALMDFCG
eukprot:7261609-Lingulodinium_polyedra.AAC.1